MFQKRKLSFWFRISNFTALWYSLVLFQLCSLYILNVCKYLYFQFWDQEKVAGLKPTEYGSWGMILVLWFRCHSNPPMIRHQLWHFWVIRIDFWRAMFMRRFLLSNICSFGTKDTDTRLVSELSTKCHGRIQSICRHPSPLLY